MGCFAQTRGSFQLLQHRVAIGTQSRSLDAKLERPNQTPGLCLLGALLITMDGYPLGSLDHNVPLLVVSGLSSSHEDQAEKSPKAKGRANGEGVLLRSDLPPLEGKEASFLESYFEKVNERGKSWTVVTREEPYRVRVKTVGRVRRFSHA